MAVIRDIKKRFVEISFCVTNIDIRYRKVSIFMLIGLWVNCLKYIIFRDWWLSAHGMDNLYKRTLLIKDVPLVGK